MRQNISLGEPGMARTVWALEKAWNEIQSHHPQLPKNVMITVSASRGTARCRKLGHFGASRWRSKEETGTDKHEIWIAGENLLHAEDAFEILLHEAAHALNYARGITDTDKTGRAHNKHYKQTAEELGLLVKERDPAYGYAFTEITKDVVKKYANLLVFLDEILKSYRIAEPPPPQPQRLLRGECSYGRIIRASATVFTEGAPICPLCKTEFIHR